MRNLGISDELSCSFSSHMISASLTLDDVQRISRKPPGLMEWHKIEDSLETALGKDISLQQAEFHLGKAFEACRAEFYLERESTPHLNKAHDDIWEVVRKHKGAQRSSSA